MPQFPVTHLVQNTLAGRCCTSAIFCFYLSLYTHIPFTPISQLSCLQKGLVHLEFNLLSSKLTQLSCTISANPSPPCSAHSAMGTDRQERGPPTKPSNPLFMDLHRFFFLESFHQGLLSSDHLNHCFAPHYRTYTVLGTTVAFLGGRNQTELYSFGKKTQSFPVRETVSKCLQCSSPVSSSFLIRLSR